MIYLEWTEWRQGGNTGQTPGESNRFLVQSHPDAVRKPNIPVACLDLDKARPYIQSLLGFVLLLIQKTHNNHRMNQEGRE